MFEKKIKNSFDPYLILRLECLNPEEEIERITEDFDKLLSPDEIFRLSNIPSANISKKYDYVITNRSTMNEVSSIMAKIGVEFIMTDITDEVWNSSDIKSFITKFEGFIDVENYQQSDLYETLKVIAESRYTQDDVLDKISRTGIESLNELNKWILNG